MKKILYKELIFIRAMVILYYFVKKIFMEFFSLGFKIIRSYIILQILIFSITQNCYKSPINYYFYKFKFYITKKQRY